jgi:hypothetical protein
MAICKNKYISAICRICVVQIDFTIIDSCLHFYSVGVLLFRLVETAVIGLKRGEPAGILVN